MQRHARLASLLAVLLLLLTLPAAAHAVDGLPSFGVRFLGTGSPVAINNTGTVVGARLSGSNYQPLVSVAGAAWVSLPVPDGAESVFPTDVNDSGVIVGVSYTAFNAIAVRWTPTPAGYVVEILPRLPGDTSSYAVAVNNLGQVVGARRALGYVPALTTGWLYSDALGVVDLYAEYGWAVSPTDINDSGLLIAGVERLDLATGVIEPIGAGPSNYNAVTAVVINNAGMMAGSAVLRSSSLNIVSAFRHDGTTGWSFIAGSSRYTTVTSMNLRGDIGYGELGTGLYLDGLGAYALGSLLDPAAKAAGWTITGSGAEINDQRVIAALGRNTLTGEAGTVLLTPVGIVQPPAAPVLVGIAHPATSDAPWDAISLSWTVSAGASSYVVERQGPADPAFVVLTPGTGTIQQKYDDTAILPLTTYTYRVRAIGIAGSSLPSNQVTVVSPSARDSVAPVAQITSPANGAVVSGIVTVTASASDNVGLRGFEIRYQPNAGNEVLCARTYATPQAADTLSCTWDPRSLASGTVAQLTAFAWDDIGNYTMSPISVTYSTAGTPDTVAPTVTVVSPAKNAVVSGVVRVVARATDNVGVVRMEIRSASGALLKSVDGTEITYDWNTAGLKRGSTQTLKVRAFDAQGNVGTGTVSVRIKR